MNFFYIPSHSCRQFCAKTLHTTLQWISGYIRETIVYYYLLSAREREVFLLLSFNIFSSLSPWLIAFLIIYFFFLKLNYLLHTMQVSQ